MRLNVTNVTTKQSLILIQQQQMTIGKVLPVDFKYTWVAADPQYEMLKETKPILLGCDKSANME